MAPSAVKGAHILLMCQAVLALAQLAFLGTFLLLALVVDGNPRGVPYLLVAGSFAVAVIWILSRWSTRAPKVRVVAVLVMVVDLPLVLFLEWLDPGLSWQSLAGLPFLLPLVTAVVLLLPSVTRWFRVPDSPLLG